MIFIAYVLLFRVDIIQSVPFNSIARLICAGCTPETNKCCVGTAVSHKHFLTTYYCAQTCQFVKRGDEEVPIRKIHVDPFPKTFVISDNFVGPNTVALVEVKYDENKNYSFVNLEVNKQTNFPLFRPKAVMPIFDKLHQFRPTIIKQCDKNTEYSNGYYVCAADEVYEDCEIPQGTPLFLEEKLLGITGITNSLTCEYANRIFIGLEPTIYWIKYVIDEDLLFYLRRLMKKTVDEQSLNTKNSTKGLDNKKKPIKSSVSHNSHNKTKNKKINEPKKIFSNRNITQRKKITNKVARKLSIAKSHTRKLTTTVIYKKRFNNINSKSRNISKKHLAIRNKNKINKSRGTCSRPESKSTSVKTTKSKKIVKTTIRNISQASFKTGSKTNSTQTTKSKKNVKTTIKTISSSFKTPHSKSTKSLLISTKKIINKSKKVKLTKLVVSKVRKNTKITNVMDWFIQIRNKTKNDRPQILVLTTSNIPLPEFVDLT